MPADIDHPVLGRLWWNPRLSTWETEVELHAGDSIDLSITTRMDMAPTDDLDALLNGGVAMLEWARRAERACRERIADELLELYNDTWAPEGEATPMSRAEFIKRIAPSSLVRDIDGSGFFYWADDDMFAGHRIELRFDANHVISEVGLAG
jgi:hypothetical protein